MHQNKWLIGGAIVVLVAGLAVFALKPGTSDTANSTSSSTSTASSSASGLPVLYEFYTDW